MSSSIADLYQSDRLWGFEAKFSMQATTFSSKAKNFNHIEAIRSDLTDFKSLRRDRIACMLYWDKTIRSGRSATAQISIHESN